MDLFNDGVMNVELLYFILKIAKHFIIQYPLISGLIIILLLACIHFNHKLKRYSEHREARKCESPIETRLFNALIKEGYQVYTQVPCGKYRIDLAVYSRGRKIAIEADGKAYHSSPSQLKHDEQKNQFLRKSGWKVIRFTGSEIYRNSKNCVQQVEELM